MKCPLLLAGWNAAKGGDLTYKPDCLKGECAWWMGGDGVCAITALAGKLYDLDTVLEIIKDNMPHKAQFRK